MNYTNIKDPSSLRISQELKIPPQATDTPVATSTPSPEPTQTSTPSPTSTHTPGPTKTASSTRTPRTSPTATATPEPTATPTRQAATGPTTYVVKPGDTLLAIANLFERSVKAISVYNDITDPTSLRVNQEIKIPPASYTPPPPTPRPPTRTPTPQATPTPSISLSAPVLVNPGNETPFQGRGALIVMEWQNPTGLPAGIENVMNIGVVTGPDTFELRFTEPLGRATEFSVPNWLFDQGSQANARAFVWYVQAASISRDNQQVIDMVPVSPPSETRRFYWN
jgi:LysM repeat protein